MPANIVCAVDDSPTAENAGLWTALNLARPGDTVHFISIAPAPSYVMTSAPIASPGAVAALSINWEQQRKAEEEACRQLLVQLVHKLPESVREGLDIHIHVLPAAGGASGVADSVVAFAKSRDAGAVVVGSRGMGAVRSTLMSLVGLGSVSSQLVHSMHCPVVVCHGRERDREAQASRRVMVGLDDSDASRRALEWAVGSVLGPEDELHLVCVALPIPYPVSPSEQYTSPPLPKQEWELEHAAALHAAQATAAAAAHHAAGPLQIIAEDAASSEVLEADEWDSATQDSIHYAREIVAQAVDRAAAKVNKKRIVFTALPPEGGASDVGASLVRYAREKGVDLVVMGARGMGSFKRAVMSFVGLGSVSDYVVGHVDAPVAIVKQL